jgi:hypothetical protein
MTKGHFVPNIKQRLYVEWNDYQVEYELSITLTLQARPLSLELLVQIAIPQAYVEVDVVTANIEEATMTVCIKRGQHRTWD